MIGGNAKELTPFHWLVNQNYTQMVFEAVKIKIN